MFLTLIPFSMADPGKSRKSRERIQSFQAGGDPGFSVWGEVRGRERHSDCVPGTVLQELLKHFLGPDGDSAVGLSLYCTG